MTNVLDNLPEKEPTALVAGDTWGWKRTDLGGDYSNATHTLTYKARLENGGATVISITADNDGADYKVDVAAATTAAYTAGIYHWDAYITRTSDSARVRVDHGTFEVRPNLATATSDPRTHVKIMLDKIESILQGRADADVDNYSIAGRSLSKIPIPQLIEWRNRYRAEHVKERRQERIRRGQAGGQTIKVRF